jgi:hypothetical protein
MNDQTLVISEQQDDHLDHVPSTVRSDNQDLRWVGIRIEVDHHGGAFDRVPNVFFPDAMSSSRTVDLHTGLV